MFTSYYRMSTIEVKRISGTVLLKQLYYKVLKACEVSRNKIIINFTYV